MKVFFSYAISDLITFHIPELAQKLEHHPAIEKIFYWNRDNTKELSIIDYMEKSLTECDVMVAFCSPNATNSGAVKQELDMAVYLNKQIVPVFRDINDVRLSLRPKRGIQIQEEMDQLANDISLILTGSPLKNIDEKYGNDKLLHNPIEDITQSKEIHPKNKTVLQTFQNSRYYSQNYAKPTMKIRPHRLKDFEIQRNEKAAQEVKQHPDDANTWAEWGLALKESKQFADAIEKWEKAVELNPNNDVWWKQWGICLANVDWWAEAIEKFVKAIEINPKNGEAWRMWGRSLVQLERYPEALEMFNKGLEVDPDNAMLKKDLERVMRKIKPHENMNKEKNLRKHSSTEPDPRRNVY